MQLGRRPTLSSASDIATALTETTLGAADRPAFTVLRADRREEQGFRTFAQWVAKGAHLLQVDFDLQPGDRVHLDSPLSWAPAAVACACWWVGASLTAEPEGAALTVRHELRRGPTEGDVLWLGDGIDGGPRDPALPSWSAEVVVFPDSPPPPVAGADRDALITPAGRTSQAELLNRARALGGPDASNGSMGLPTPDLPLAAWVEAAVRPLVTGRATVVVDRADPVATQREPVDWWLARATPIPGEGAGSQR